MIILNEIMDTMSQEKRAILLNRIAFRQKARSSVDAITPKIVKQPNHYASEVNKRALKSNIKKYGIKAFDLPFDYLRDNEDIIEQDGKHIGDQYKKLTMKKLEKIKVQQDKSNQDSSPNNTSIPKTEAPKSTSTPPRQEALKSNGLQIAAPRSNSTPPPRQEAPRSTNKPPRQEAPKSNDSWLSRNKGKVALGIGVGTAAAYGIHKYRQNKKKKEEEARRQAEAEAQKKTGIKRFFK